MESLFTSSSELFPRDRYLPVSYLSRVTSSVYIFQFQVCTYYFFFPQMVAHYTHNSVSCFSVTLGNTPSEYVCVHFMFLRSA